MAALVRSTIEAWSRVFRVTREDVGLLLAAYDAQLRAHVHDRLPDSVRVERDGPLTTWQQTWFKSCHRPRLWSPGRADGSERRESVRPRHIAVLVPTNRLAALVDDALERADVPAVINGAGSVFASL